MEKSLERTQRTFIRLLFGIFLGLVVLIGGIWGGRDLYLRWQEKRLVRRATLDMEQGNERDASLAARSILEMKPTSPAGARIMAELAEKLGERAALDWRRKVVQLAPPVDRRTDLELGQRQVLEAFWPSTRQKISW